MDDRQSKFAPKHYLLHYKYYTYYRGNKKKTARKNWVKNRAELMAITDKILEVISKNLIEREGGVLMNNFGYFCVWRAPRKQVFNVYRKGKSPKTMLNFHTDGHMYFPQIFTNMFKKDPFRGWTLDRAIHSKVNHDLSVKLKQGKKYKFYYSIAKRIYTKKFIKDR